MSLSSLLLCCFSLSEGAYNENCEGCPANTEHFASWTQDEVGFQGLELLQTSSTLVKTVSANKAAEKGVSKFEEDESEEEEEEQEESEEEPCPLPQNAVWCTAKSGDKRWTMALYEDFEDNFVSTRVCESGFWEFPTLESMGLPRMHKEMVLLDIGANIGWYTFMFAAHGHKVLAVEPMTKKQEIDEGHSMHEPRSGTTSQNLCHSFNKCCSQRANLQHTVLPLQCWRWSFGLQRL